MNQFPVIHRALSFGEPIAIRPELGERVPLHADRLRYDIGFHHPDDVSLVVFPRFGHSRLDAYADVITPGQWSSPSCRLELAYDLGALRGATEEQEAALPTGVTPFRITNIDDWVGYLRIAPEYGLETTTFGSASRRYTGGKFKLLGWRQI